MNTLGRVAIHINTYPLPSEVFVREQARSLRRFEPTLFVRSQTGPSADLDCQPIANAGDGRGWAAKAFALRPGIWAWGGKHAFAGVRLVHAHFGPNGVYALPLARALGVPLVVSFHGFDATMRPTALAQGGVAGIAYLLGLPELKRGAARVIAVSAFLAARLRMMGFAESAIRQHYIGVDPDRFTPLEPHERSLDIVCVARLVPAKGIEELLRAFALVAPRFPESRLRLVGAGPGAQQYAGLAAALGIGGKVVFHGALAHEAVALVVARCALSVLVSKTGENGAQEAFGLGSIEAAASGLPSIVSSNGGLPETVEHGVTGMVVPEARVAELADAIATFLADAGLRARFGAAGRARVLARFALGPQTQKLEDIYCEATDL
jgi:colanic acid/amylovoran biosynthesis glycosyltransferase